MTVFLFIVYTLLSGAQQGIITWLFREYVPATRKDWVHAALHYGGVLIYLVLIAWACYGANGPRVVALLIHATLARVVFFDLALNTSRSWFNHREGRPWGNPYEVGTIALSDRATRWLANETGMEPEQLRFLLWLLSLLLGGLGWPLLTVFALLK